MNNDPPGKSEITKFWAIGALANGMIMIWVVLIYASITEQITAEQRMPDFGDSLNFLMSAVPALILCFLFNLYWVFGSFQDIRKRRDYHSLIALVATIVAWGLLYFLSFLLR